VTRDRATTIFFLALSGAALVARPLAHGIPGATITAFWAVALGQVLLPGVLLIRGARLGGGGDPWALLGQGATIGLALQAVAFLAGRALGLPWLTTAAAVAAGAIGIVLGGRQSGEAPAAAPPASPWTLAVMLGALLVLPLNSAARIGEPVPFDLLFHSGTAGELRHRWPLQDPRVAGVPLHYHVLSYALPIEAADLASAPLYDTLLALAPLLWVALLALQLSNAGRLLFGDARAGVLGAAVALFHADPGEALGLGPGAFNSHLATALYGSPTTLCSFVLLAGLVVSLQSWVEARRGRDLLAAGLLAAAASGTKTTLLPVVVAGLALAVLREWWLGRHSRARDLGTALLALAAAGAPFTLWQTFGDSSYSRMAHPGFVTAFTGSPAVEQAARWLGSGVVSGLSAPLLFAAWLVGHLGLAGVGAALWLARRRAELTTMQACALAVAAAALAFSLAVDAPEFSQLFFAYNGMLLLCLFAGAALARELTARPLRKVAAAALVLVCLPAAAKWARALPAMVRADVASAAAVPSRIEREYSLALTWLRAHASRDAVIFADNPSLLLSAFGEVRLYYENGLYTARARQTGPGAEPWPERAALQERVLRRPDAAALEEARSAIGPAARLLVVADSVQSRIEGGFVEASIGPVPRRRLFPEPLFELRFANAAVHVYEARGR
jgi:hypothetical protein